MINKSKYLKKIKILYLLNEWPDVILVLIYFSLTVKAAPSYSYLCVGLAISSAKKEKSG